MNVERVGALTPELLELMEHEKGIEQGLCDIGARLMAIRDGRLYRAVGFSSFDLYCRERWSFTRNYADKQIVAAATVEAIEASTRVLTPPTSERQVRPLSVLPMDERAAAWSEAVEAADGEQPTAAEVAAVVERRRPQAVPKPAAAPGVPPHPATFPAAVVELFVDLLHRDEPGLLLDPFAGVGTIHALRQHGWDTHGVELEAEWAEVHDRTVCGDARRVAALFPGVVFDAVVTSPAYGNRLADGFYDAADPEARRTYALDLGRPLNDGNGAGMHFGTDGAYETLHAQVWTACVAVLHPGGLFVLNVKDFVRGGRAVPVVGWHVATLHGLGLDVVDVRTLPAAGLPHTTAKPFSEVVVVLRNTGSP